MQHPDSRMPIERVDGGAGYSRFEVGIVDCFEKEKIMKSGSISVCSRILGIILFALVFFAVGCSQPGETVAEGHRRHLRNLRINQQEMMQDVDRVILADQPSKLTDKRIP